MSDFAKDISSLDSERRRETDPVRKSQLLCDIAHLKNGTDRPNGKHQIGRQMRVRNRTYKPPEAKWLKEALERIEGK